MATSRGARETGPSLADAALGLAREGWEVFPCGPDKAPRTTRGFHDATSDEEVVAGWDWDGALIGAAIPAGQVVLDVDPRNGGDETMAALKAAGHKLPRTRVVKTGGGGTHYYYRVPDGLELRGKLGNGVDVKRAGRGYVIVPPSPGYRFAFTKNEPAVDLPEWLLDALRAPERGESTGEASAPRFFQWEEGTAYGLKALEGVLDRLANAEPGSRNDELNRAAFSIAQLVAGGELAEEASLKALEATALDIGLRPGETRKTIASGWEAGSAEPRQAPPRAETASPEPHVATSIFDAFKPLGDDDPHFWLDWSKDEPATPYLLDPIIPEGAYLLVYGPAEASKSMVFQGLCSEASHLGVKSTIYSLENPPSRDRDRYRRFGADPDFLRSTNQPLDLNDDDQFKRLVERESAWGTRIVVIDTYSHAFGSRSEDGNVRAIEFARRVRILMHVVGCSVVVIDHTGYAHDEPRDASAKRQQVDVCVLMEGGSTAWIPGRDAHFRMENRKYARFGNRFEYSGRIKGGLTDPLELAWDGGGPTWKV